MAQLNPYIHFNGNAEEALTFYKSVFGGEFATVSRFKDFASPEQPFSVQEENKIMHIALPIDKNSVLMASDVPDILGQVNEQENRSKISISAESKEEADRLFNPHFAVQNGNGFNPDVELVRVCETFSFLKKMSKPLAVLSRSEAGFFY